jgi:hypothetical protein
MSSYQKASEFVEDMMTIIDKSGNEVPFKLNPIQRKFVEQSTGRDIILKARQQGFSSFILAAFTKDFLLKDNSLSVVVADIADNAQDLLSRVKHYIRSVEQTTGTKVDLKYNSKYELHNADNNARYIIGTAENTEFGRSKTITNLHFSEAAFYKHFSKLLAGAGTALVPDGRFVVETTANGFNEFKTFYNESELNETDFKALFYKASDFYSAEFLDKEKKRLGRLYMQEYPESALEAFITSGESYFDQEAMRHYLSLVKEPLAV